MSARRRPLKAIACPCKGCPACLGRYHASTRAGGHCWLCAPILTAPERRLIARAQDQAAAAAARGELDVAEAFLEAAETLGLEA